MTKNNWSPVEKRFFQRQYIQNQTTKIPYILVDNFPDLGFLTSLRFLEWVSKNPEGVISLPTGKTPEYFMKWTHHFLFLKINIIQYFFLFQPVWHPGFFWPNGRYNKLNFLYHLLSRKNRYLLLA